MFADRRCCRVLVVVCWCHSFGTEGGRSFIWLCTVFPPRESVCVCFFFSYQHLLCGCQHELMLRHSSFVSNIQVILYYVELSTLWLSLAFQPPPHTHTRICPPCVACESRCYSSRAFWGARGSQQTIVTHTTGRSQRLQYFLFYFRQIKHAVRILNTALYTGFVAV